MKYMAKLPEIEAVRYIEDNDDTFDAVMAFMAGEINKHPDGWLKGVGRTITHVWNHIEKAWHPVHDGDYIIRGPHGEYYPLSRYAFEANYEPMRPLTKEDVDDAIATIKSAILGIRSDMAEHDLYGRGKIENLEEQQAELEEERDK